MAVRGFLTIKEEDGEYVLTRVKRGGAKLTPEESVIAKKLLAPNMSIALKNENHEKIRSALRSFRNSLKLSCETHYFLTNTGYLLPGLVRSLALLACGVLDAPMGGIALFIFVWLAGWTTGVSFLLSKVVEAWRDALYGGSHRLTSGTAAVFLSVFSLPFIGGEIFGLFLFGMFTSTLMLAVLITVLAMNYIFYRLLKAPTRAGRKVLDKIEGFTMYLSVAEKHRLNMLNPPEKTPELFEKYLPYALALDVEQKWSEQFADVLAGAAAEPSGYSPGWYHDAMWSSMGASGFASSFGSSFSSAVSSSSTAPGSGSGGGGSSGGGGGW